MCPPPYPFFSLLKSKVNTGGEAQCHVIGVHGEPLENFPAFEAPWFTEQLTYQMRQADDSFG